jgi:hypothetical protein
MEQESTAEEHTTEEPTTQEIKEQVEEAREPTTEAGPAKTTKTSLTTKPATKTSDEISEVDKCHTSVW